MGMGFEQAQQVSVRRGEYSITVCAVGLKTYKRYRSYSQFAKPEGTTEFLAGMTRDELLTVAAAAIHEYEQRETQL